MRIFLFSFLILILCYLSDKTKDSVTSDTDSETDEEQLSDESFDNQNDEQCHLMKYKDHKGQRQIPRVYFTLDQSKVYSIYRVLLSKKSVRNCICFIFRGQLSQGFPLSGNRDLG